MVRWRPGKSSNPHHPLWWHWHLHFPWEVITSCLWPPLCWFMHSWSLFWLSIIQVTVVPLLSSPPYLLSLSPNPSPKLPSFYFPIILHVNIPTILLFKHTLLLNYIFPFHAPSFRFFWDYLWLPSATGTSLHLYTLYFIVFPYSPPPEWPILLSCPCLPAILPTHFDFSNPIFLGTFCIYFNYYICIHVHM